MLSLTIQSERPSEHSPFLQLSQTLKGAGGRKNSWLGLQTKADEACKRKKRLRWTQRPRRGKKKSEQKAKHRYPAPEPAPTSAYRQSHIGTARPKPPPSPRQQPERLCLPPAPTLSLPHANRGLAKGGRGEGRQAPTCPRAKPRAANE